MMDKAFKNKRGAYSEHGVAALSIGPRSDDAANGSVSSPASSPLRGEGNHGERSQLGVPPPPELDQGVGGAGGAARAETQEAEVELARRGEGGGGEGGEPQRPSQKEVGNSETQNHAQNVGAGGGEQALSIPAKAAGGVDTDIL